MSRVNVAKVKEHLSAYLAEVEAGGDVLVCKRNRPVAKIVPVEDVSRGNRTRLGSDVGSVTVSCDLTEPVFTESDWETL